MITIVIPVLNESPTVASAVQFALNSPNVSEVIVVDDGSIDGTPALASAAGAKVVTSTLLGKGSSLEDGVWAAQNEFILFLDGDLSLLQPDLVAQMTAPLIGDTADFVKARFTRESGRVTMLTARPLLQTFFPELNHIDQPLGGIMAGTRSLFRKLRFESDYGVDVGLLLDATALEARIAQVDIGRITHDSQSLDVLGDMAKQVVRVILDRAGRYGRLDLQQVREVEEVERRTQAELANLLTRVGQPERLALFDMDGTLLRGRIVVSLAKRVNKLSELEDLLDNPGLTAEDRTTRIAALFAEVPKTVFEETAAHMPLMKGAKELVVALRKAGYRVGIVSDSFFVATEIVRRRVYADFSIAHLMKFRRGIATGAILQSNAMLHPDGCRLHQYCKFNTLLQLCEHLQIDPGNVIAVGDGVPDCCMLRGAGTSFAFQPKSPEVAQAADHCLEDDLLEIARILGIETERLSSAS